MFRNCISAMFPRVQFTKYTMRVVRSALTINNQQVMSATVQSSQDFVRIVIYLQKLTTIFQMNLVFFFHWTGYD